ncbi:MAG: hypothetical protein HY437_02355 [Candidatus Magasanikbacteria bacterium]|nr:hypothetical protein [Candidatus Magasanikbacteria bacterium]
MWLIIFFIGLAVGATFAYAGFRGAPWVPMRRGDVERVVRLAEIKPGQTVYDLGCGDGRLLFAAAACGAAARGFEISLLPWVIAKVRWLFSKHRARVAISFKDFWFANFYDVDIVYFFLMPAAYPRLQTKLQKELKPGAMVLAYVWPFPDWKPIQVDETPGRPTIYVYRK